MNSMECVIGAAPAASPVVRAHGSVMLCTAVAALVLLAGTLGAEDAAAARLFILSGQSNMVGLDPSTSFVPELQQALPGERIVVVKDAENGQPLRRWFAREKPRDLYARLFTKVAAATEREAFASVTLVWMQGEADGEWAKDSARYATHLRGLIAQFRTDLARPDMMVVIGRISDYLNGQEHWDAVRAAQEEVAASDPLVAWIDTDDLNGADNDLHYRTAEERAELGRRLARRAIELLAAP